MLEQKVRGAIGLPNGCDRSREGRGSQAHVGRRSLTRREPMAERDEIDGGGAAGGSSKAAGARELATKRIHQGPNTSEMQTFACCRLRQVANSPCNIQSAAPGTRFWGKARKISYLRSIGRNFILLSQTSPPRDGEGRCFTRLFVSIGMRERDGSRGVLRMKQRTREPMDSVVDDLKARQRNLTGSHVLRGSRSVDEYLWKGARDAPMVQRIGAIILALAYLAVALFFIARPATAEDGRREGQ
jgi:hypothetical protein